MRACGLTDIGAVRESNQDSFAVSISGAQPVWAVVCDGMGGANGGYFASSTAVGIFSHCLDINFEGLKPKQIENVICEAVYSANSSLYKTSCEQSGLEGMGTTLVASLVCDETAYVVNVGDSRAYHIVDNSISQITTDHSVVQQLVSLGQITKEEANGHPDKNMITRAVGVKDEVDADFFSVKLKKKSVILLCTDGLTNFVSDEEILKTVSGENPEEEMKQLVNLALSRGGSDNITVVIIG